MKPFAILLFVISCFAEAMAQHPAIQLTTDKTTSLVFSAPIVHVDRGSKDVLVQRVKEATHILLAKAASSALPQTNLSVVTADGSLYSFSVSFDSLPKEWVYTVPPKGAASVEATAKSLLQAPRLLRTLKETSGGIRMEVRSIYVRGSILFYQLHLKNETAIDYDVDALRFYIRDRKKAKRTAQQELMLAPVGWALPVQKIPGHSELTTVVALEKFTAPDAKYFGIELLEKSGGRHLLLKVSNRYLFRARSLPAQ
ncbi:conjugative transposon protein TraN [Flaviaesturariibacter amylovorans]|uniref:Conjugative transposon protein TraN n=1 Tax=Flaviaesturariibacter amylovorans TaxID=1084520 RepID=A0ABP8HHY2_9BACT